jgi:hypothetical protein
VAVRTARLPRKIDPAGHGIAIIPRDEFIATRWQYKAGESVFFAGPSGMGKTQLEYELLGATATPRLPVINLVVKPRDETVKYFGQRFGFQRIETYPPPVNPFRTRPAGYNLWPRTTFDPDIDDVRMWRLFRRAMLDCYKRGRKIVNVDEITALTEELRNPEEKGRTLEREVNTLLSKGRAMGCGAWGGSQRPAYISTLWYSAHHLFLFQETDERYRRRFAEIGRIDPALVQYITAQLPEFYALYVRRSDRSYCIIAP